MYSGHTKFAFRILVKFGYIHAHNYSDVFSGFESNELFTATQICTWLEEIKKFKNENSKLNAPKNAKLSFGKIVGGFLERHFDPCECREVKLDGTPARHWNQCICVELLWYIIHNISFRSDPLCLALCLGWKENNEEYLHRNTGEKERELYSNVYKNYDSFLEFIQYTG